MTNDNTYNGWINRDTWAANLWLCDNTESIYHQAYLAADAEELRNIFDDHYWDDNAKGYIDDIDIDEVDFEEILAAIRKVCRALYYMFLYTPEE